MNPSLKGVAIVVVSYGGITGQTQKAIDQCRTIGAQLLSQYGTADVALARSIAMTKALRSIEEHQIPIDTLLLLDDDVAPSLQAIEALVTSCRELREPVSGIYATADGTLPGLEWKDDKWLMGLGFMALPFAKIKALAESLRPLQVDDGTVIPFCQSGVHVERRDYYTSEDYWFCLQLGGVTLLPIVADHIKRMPIRVNEDDAKRLLQRGT